MSNLVRTPVIDVNGKQTHVYKSAQASLNSRPLLHMPPRYKNGVDYSDYITNIWSGDNSEFTDEQIEARRKELRAGVVGYIAGMESDPEWLPEVDALDDETGDEEGFIRMMSDLKMPETSRGQCLYVSEAVSMYMKHKEGISATPVQGMPEPHPLLNVHYANLFEQEGSPAFIVDFTYSQVDETAEFPLIVTPQEWVAGIEKGLAEIEASEQAFRNA